MAPHEEFVRRAKVAGILRLAPLHHYVMDKLFVDFHDEFTFNDALQQYSKNPRIFNDVAIREIKGRIKLIVIRALEGLVAIGMLREITFDSKCYFRSWTPLIEGGSP